MAVVSKANAPVIFDLKSAALTLVALVLKTTDWLELGNELEERFGNVPVFFDQDPVAIDLSQVRDAPGDIDFAGLLALLRRHKMVPIAAKGGSAHQMEAARAAGLVEAPDGAGPSAAPPRAAAMPEVVLTEVIREVPIAAPPALVVDKPLRSGQQVYARGGDLVVLAVVSFGAEVIADGSIHVYAPLRGRAIAGAQRQRRRAHLHDLHGAAAGLHRRHLPHHRNRAAGRRARQAGAGAPGRRDARRRSAEACSSPRLERKDLQPMAKIVVVTSGKGGVGKTTTSASFASGPRAARATRPR